VDKSPDFVKSQPEDLSMQIESVKVSALRYLLLVNQADEDWTKVTAEALGCTANDLASPDRIDRIWNTGWGSVENALLMGSPDLPLNGLHALIWHRPDGGPALVDPSNSLSATKMARFALQGSLIAALRAENLVPYVRQGWPLDWRRMSVWYRGEQLDHVIWADAVTQQAEVWNRRGKFQEPGVLPVHRLSGSIVIELGTKDPGFL